MQPLDLARSAAAPLTREGVVDDLVFRLRQRRTRAFGRSAGDVRLARCILDDTTPSLSIRSTRGLNATRRVAA
jgi:hypothetical protein